MSDPYAKIAKPAQSDDPYASIANSSGGTAAPEMAPNTFNPMHPIDNMKSNLPGLVEFGKGLVKGAGHTIGMADEWAGKHLPAFMTTPIGQHASPEGSAQHIADYKKLTTPTNEAQSVGHGGEQAAEYLLPTGIEEGAARLGTAALGKGAGVLARAAGAGVHSGLINKAQGGDFTTGAATGAGGSLLGQGAAAIAPHAVELAQGIKNAGGRTGRAILDETKGILPGSIRSSAQGALDTLNPELNAVTDKSTAMIPMQSARDAAQEQINRAVGQNQKTLIAGTKRMGNQLQTRSFQPALGAAGPSGNIPIPDSVSATDYRQLKQGIGKALPAGSWSPQSSNAFVGPRNAIYGTMADEFHKAVPEAASLDSRISSLIPATKPPTGSLFGHAAGPATGALVGGYEGAQHGGVEGAVKGALLGGTIGVAAPAAINAGARLVYSPATQRLIPLIGGTGLQYTRPNQQTGDTQ